MTTVAPQNLPLTQPPFRLRDGRALAWGIPVLSLIISWLNWPKDLPESWSNALINWLISVIFTTSYWLADRTLWVGLLRALPRPEQTTRRLWMLAGAAVALAALVTAMLLGVLHQVRPEWFALNWRNWLLTIRLSLIPTVVVLSLYEATYFFGQWQANRRRADQLAQTATQAQLDALTRQLDPHFLFNSLNTLSALIDPANDSAQRYVEGLADVYRYVLLARERPTVPLADELTLVQTYLALQQVRFGEGLHVVWQVEAANLAARVAPLSVQELVENALKHNETSRAHPLTLTVVADGRTVRVANTYQPRPAGLAPGTGTGLANLRQRYALLGASQPVAVAQAQGFFTVVLPLL